MSNFYILKPRILESISHPHKKKSGKVVIYLFPNKELYSMLKFQSSYNIPYCDTELFLDSVLYIDMYYIFSYNMGSFTVPVL